MCQRHSRAIKVLGLASAFLRIEHVSQAKVFSEDCDWFVFMVFSIENSSRVHKLTIVGSKCLSASVWDQIV